MNIKNGSVVSFHYTLHDEDGTEIENSRGGDPSLYLHGSNNIIRGLERAMEGHSSGDNFTVQVDPVDGYGARNPAAFQRIPVKHIVTKGKLKKGQVVSINTDQGVRTVVVTKVGRHMADVDTNHPLAGKSLKFEIDITDVRPGSQDEIAHGHAHGPGGHQH